MSDEEAQEEVIEEEVSEESTEEQPSEEATEEVVEEAPKNECIVLPEHTKPIVECCKEYDEGKIDSGDFFSKALISIGNFMQSVSKKKEAEQSE